MPFTDLFDENGERYRNRYITANIEDRQKVLQEILSKNLNTESLRTIMMDFDMDPAAEMVLFKPYIAQRIAEDYNAMVARRGEDKTRSWFGINHLAEIGFLREVYADGVKWNLDRTAVVHEIVQEQYSTKIDMEFSLLDRAQHQTEAFIAAVDKATEELKSGTLLLQLVVPVAYAWSEKSDLPVKNIDSYPIAALREVEREYNVLHNLGYGRPPELELAGCKVDILLHFSEDKQQAFFDFRSAKHPDIAVASDDIEQAKEFVYADLSDGFGEDTVRFELLVGKEVLTPLFDSDNLTIGYIFEPTTPKGVPAVKIR